MRPLSNFKLDNLIVYHQKEQCKVQCTSCRFLQPPSFFFFSQPREQRHGSSALLAIYEEKCYNLKIMQGDGV